MLSDSSLIDVQGAHLAIIEARLCTLRNTTDISFGVIIVTWPAEILEKIDIV